MRLLKTIILVISCSSLNAQVNLQDGLVAYYPFNDNVNDRSGNGFHGTPVNSPSLTTDLLGRTNAAYSFNGASTYIKLGDILDSVFAKSPVATFSISGWAKTNSLSSIQGDNMIIAKSGGGSGPYQWYILHENDGKVGGLIANSPTNVTNYYELKSTLSISMNTWFNFILIYNGAESNDSNRLKFYVNGNEGAFSRKAGSGGTTTTNTNQEITIGGTYLQSNGNPHNIYDGSVDEIRIYNRPLTIAEVDSLQTFSTELRTSSNKVKKEESIVFIYPNPSESGVFYYENQDVKTIEVFDIAGKTKKVIHEPKGIINLTDLSAGAYYIKLTGENVHLTTKLIYW